MRVERNAENCTGCEFKEIQTDSLYFCNRLNKGIWLIDFCITGRMVRLPKDVREALALATKMKEIWAYDQTKK